MSASSETSISGNKWPKKVPDLTPERQAIRDDFMRAHLEAMQTKWYGVIERFNHKYPLRSAFPGARVQAGDCQERLPYDDEYFDRVLAIHVLEHLPNLPAALKEIKRILKPGGVLSVVIPCEGGLAYTLARNISARPHFEKKYQQFYD